MWPDNETDLDFLNFSGIADTVAEIVAQANGRPISIGVSGAWGAGKSSLIKLTQKALATPSKANGRDYVFVEFNAWLYQGYDDARAALMEEIATTLEAEAKKRSKAKDKVISLLRRVNWLRAAKLTAGSALALSLGLPPVGLLGDLLRSGKSVFGGNATEKDVQALTEAGGKAEDAAKGLLSPPPESSAPKQIRELRDSFEAILKELGITLVVLIDDLDRCLPETTISTLEAIRLFLFLKNTAFVIAADDDMIRHAVRRHFGTSDSATGSAGISETAVTNYFDKLIQIPIRVPPLGLQEVRAYLMLLYVETSNLTQDKKDAIRTTVISKLARSWEGLRVDRALIESVTAVPDELRDQLETAERLAPLMTSTAGVAGNPRLIKRFLNALSIRMSISRAQNVGVDYRVLAKMLLLERMDTKLYSLVVEAVSSSASGKPAFLAELERLVDSGSNPLPEPWNGIASRAWVGLAPPLSDQNLRGTLYVSREHAPLMLPEDRLTPEGSALLQALLTHPGVAETLQVRLNKLPPEDTTIMMSRLFEKATQELEWGAPPLLEACLAIGRANAEQGERLAAFLKTRPGGQIRPNIVPKIDSELWAKSVLDGWLTNALVSPPVKSAITTRRARGNKSVK